MAYELQSPGDPAQASRTALPSPVINSNTAGFGSNPQGPGIPGSPMMPTQRIVRRPKATTPIFSGNPSYNANYNTGIPAAPNVTARIGGGTTANPASGNTGANPQSMTTLPQTQVRAPIVGGTAAQDQMGTGQRKVDQAAAVANKPVENFQPNHLSASNTGANKVSEETLHAMWNASLRNYQDPNKALNDFSETAAKYNVNGPALVDHWKKIGAPNMQTTYRTDPGYHIPVSMVGTDKSGGTPAQATTSRPNTTGAGLIQDERGMNLTSPAMRTATGTAPLSGYSTLGSDFILPSTRDLNRSADNPDGGASAMQAAGMLKQAAIRDNAQAPFPAGTAEQNRANESANLLRSGNEQMANAPVLPRELFETNADIARAAAEVPIAKIEKQNEGKEKVAETQTEGKKYTADKGLEGKKVTTQASTTIADNKNKTQEKIAGSKNAATTQKATIDAQGKVAAAKAKSAGGIRTADGTRLTWREVNAAYNNLSRQGKNDQEIEDSLNKLYGAGAVDQLRKSTTKPSETEAQTPAQTAQAPAQAVEQQPGDQVHQGFVYRPGPDGQYHKVGPAAQQPTAQK